MASEAYSDADRRLLTVLGFLMVYPHSVRDIVSRSDLTSQQASGACRRLERLGLAFRAEFDQPQWTIYENRLPAGAPLYYAPDGLEWLAGLGLLKRPWDALDEDDIAAAEQDLATGRTRPLDEVRAEIDAGAAGA